MSEAKPPSYEASFSASKSASGVTSCAPCINEGYEGDEGISKPPTAPVFESLTNERAPFISFSVLTDEDLREVCYEYVEEETCCYGSRFIRDMTLADIYNNYTFHYKLETFTEKRESAWAHTSYRGETIDGPENGPPPNPWDMSVRPQTKFKDDWTVQEIPHTAYVKRCFNCGGTGKVTCSYCSGSGSTSCSSCSGSGKNSDDENCSSCSGSGTQSCSSCWGSGRQECSTCDGRGNLKHYRKLIVNWKNYIDDFISDSMKLPNDLIKDVSGREIFKEEYPQVQPLTHSPDNTVNDASVHLINTHKKIFRLELQLMQRHTLWAVPLTRGIYIWKKKQGEFYVYGFQKKVYFENYPQKCCCICC